MKNISAAYFHFSNTKKRENTRKHIGYHLKRMQYEANFENLPRHNVPHSAVIDLRTFQLNELNRPVSCCGARYHPHLDHLKKKRKGSINTIDKKYLIVSFLCT